MTKKNLGIIAAALIVAVSLGGFVYSGKKADAKEAIAKQAVMDNIGKQQDLQEAAKQAKADAPVVSEESPARITPVAGEAPKESTPAPEPTKQTSTATANATKGEPIAIPQQSPTPPKVAPTVVTPPPAQQEPVQAVTSLSDADIQHLQSYAQYATAGGKTSEAYIPFDKMYTTERADCDGLVKAFSPITLSDYFKMKTEWLTSPKLVYQNVIGDFCIRGVLTLTAYEDNKLGLIPNVKYQVDVEYRLDNSVKNGKITLSLSSTHYLSGFKAVK